MIQLDFLQDDEITVLQDRMQKVESSCDRVRKSLFAKNGEINKLCIELRERLDILEKYICSQG